MNQERDKLHALIGIAYALEAECGITWHPGREQPWSAYFRLHDAVTVWRVEKAATSESACDAMYHYVLGQRLSSGRMYGEFLEWKRARDLERRQKVFIMETDLGNAHA
jgi:hypothetical protein